ncbi:MAG: hypothetical protein JNK82_30645 [Myxococcaceae bacterium]|nr:hypothetical protein [Myxococcaceae bacterium]
MRLLCAGLVIVASACHCELPGQSPAVEPPPPTPVALPPSLLAELPRNDAGLPILVRSDEGVAGIAVGFVFDEALDDPIARWGECVQRITDCYRVAGTRPVRGCIAKLERCADDTGGTACCPPACFAAFEAALGNGSAEDDAVRATFFEGSCVAGFADQVDGGEVTP